MNNIPAFKEKLERERMLVIDELKGVGVLKDQRNPDDWQAVPADDGGNERADSNDVADKIGSYENNNAIVQDLETRLTEIDIALQRIEQGNYGTCTVCKNPIEEDRLDANPAAMTCKAHMK